MKWASDSIVRVYELPGIMRCPKRYNLKKNSGSTLGELVKMGFRQAVLERFEKMGYIEVTPDEKPNRNCMICDKAFYSVGPHNRMCSYCRRTVTNP